jgi:hypothetical protein
MKRYLATIGNIFVILFGLLGLRTPYITDAFNAVGIGFIADSTLLQPVFIGFVIIAILGEFYKVRETLLIWPIIAELILGVLGYLFIFPFQNLIIGYIILGLIFLLLFHPLIRRITNKKKIVKIQI